LNKKGVTIIELLIYIVLFAIVALVISKQFKTLVNNFSSGKRVARQQTDTRDIMGLMVHDIRNTGLKIYFTGSGTSITKNTAPGVTIGTNDNSSFVYTNVTSVGTDQPAGDILTFNKAVLTRTGDLDHVETIKYYLDGSTLKRTFTQDNDATTSTVAENVWALQFQYGVSTVYSKVVPFSPAPTSTTWPNTTSSGTTVTAEYSSSGITLPINGTSTGYLKCNLGSAIPVVANRKYDVTLQIDPSGGFPENLTSMAFSFRNANHGSPYGSETFKPCAAGAFINITVPVYTTASAYAYLDYTTSGAGALLVKGIEVQCPHFEGDAGYWKNDPTVEEKQNTSAIKVFVLTRSKTKTETSVSGDITMADVTFTRSGEYTWRLYTQTIEIPNNRVF
jgi:type II secretory pathway component PulJ